MKEEENKSNQVSGLKQMNPYIFAGLPHFYQNLVSNKSNTKLDRIMGIVSDVVDIPAKKIVLDSREGDLVKARHLFCFFACQVESESEVSRYLSKNRATVRHSRNTTLNVIENETVSRFKDFFTEINNKLQAAGLLNTVTYQSKKAFSKDQIEYIKKMRSEGRNYTNIAKIMETSPRIIELINNDKIYE